MDDIKLALLGNQEAAKRLTDAGCYCHARVAGVKTQSTGL